MLKIRDCWDTVERDPPRTITALLGASAGIPTEADLTLTLAAKETTVEAKANIREQPRALEWRGKDLVDEALIHRNVKPTHHASFRLAS